MDKQKTEFRDRARRFSLESPMFFRRAGEQEWRQGRTMNISRSGLLFEAPEPIEPRTPLEVRLELPVAGPAAPPAHVTCRGEVVRDELPTERNGPHRLAAAILRFNFAREQVFAGADTSRPGEAAPCGK